MVYKERAGSQKDLGVLEDGPREADALLLPTAYLW